MVDNDSSFQRYFSPNVKVLGSTQSSFCIEMLNKSYFGNNEMQEADDCSKNWSSEDRSISKIINDAANLKNSGYSLQQNSESNEPTEINQSIIWGANINSQDSSQFTEKYKCLKRKEEEKRKVKKIERIDSGKINIKEFIFQEPKLVNEEKPCETTPIKDEACSINNFSFKIKEKERMCSTEVKINPIYLTTGILLEDNTTNQSSICKGKHKNDSIDYGLDIEEFSSHKLNFNNKAISKDTKTIESSDKSFNDHTRNISEQMEEVNINQINSVNFKNINLTQLNEKQSHSNSVDSPKFMSCHNSNKSSFIVNGASDKPAIVTPVKLNPPMNLGQGFPQVAFNNGSSQYNFNFTNNYTPKRTYIPQQLNVQGNASNHSTISTCNATNSIKHHKQENEAIQDKKTKISLKLPTEESINSYYSTNHMSNNPYPNIFPSPTNLQMNYSSSFINYYQPNFNTISHHNSNNPFTTIYCPTNLNTPIYKPSLINLSKASHFSTYTTSSNYSSVGSSDPKDGRLTDIIIEDYASGKNKKTTLMIKNIPNRYDVEAVLTEIDEMGFKNKYDCFYLPIDSKDPQVSVYFNYLETIKQSFCIHQLCTSTTHFDVL